MSPKRGDRVAPPPPPGTHDLRYATSEAVKGWEDLCRTAPGAAERAYRQITTDPCPVPPTARCHQLKGGLSHGLHGGQSLPQWQYEATGGGRIWYLVDSATRRCWMVHAGTGHPSATD